MCIQTNSVYTDGNEADDIVITSSELPVDCAEQCRTFSNTVSPRNNCSVSIVVGWRLMTVLSSLIASSTINRLALFLRSRIAVEKSFLAASFLTAAGLHDLQYSKTFDMFGMNCLHTGNFLYVL